MNITTTLVSDSKGDKIVAKGGGKQRTNRFDPNVSPQRQHGLVAGDLALALIEGDTARKVAAEQFRVTKRGPRQMKFGF